MKIASLFRFASVLMLTLPGATYAQGDQLNTIEVSGHTTLGIAAVPDYEGADDFRLLPLVDGRVAYGERYVAIEGNAIRANVVAAEGFEFGPIASFTFARDTDVENTAVAKLGRIKDAYEVGAFAAKTFDLGGSHTLRLSMQGVHDVSDVYGGYVITAGATYATPVGERLNFLFDLGASYASDDYAETYFSVTQAGAAASGLAAFKAGGGLKDVGARFTASYRIGDNWGVVASASYRRPLGDFADSPVVNSGGSADQLSGGLGVFLTF